MSFSLHRSGMGGVISDYTCKKVASSFPALLSETGLYRRLPSLGFQMDPRSSDVSVRSLKWLGRHKGFKAADWDNITC